MNNITLSIATIFNIVEHINLPKDSVITIYHEDNNRFYLIINTIPYALDERIKAVSLHLNEIKPTLSFDNFISIYKVK